MSPDPSLDLEARAKAERLKRSFLAGRISKEGYERNLRALGVEPDTVNPPASAPTELRVGAPSAVRSPPVVNPASSGPARLPHDLEARAEQLTKLFREGKMRKETLEKNLARIYEAIEPRLAELRVAFEQGRVPKDAYVASVRRLLGPRGAPSMLSTES